MKVLLIEDDETIFELIKERFEQWSIEVVGPTDFHEVLATFEKELPEIVLIDIQLPAFDGFHWCREIRAKSNVPILFLSSRDHPMDMVMAMKLGADDFIQKPFHMEVLIAKVQAMFRRTYDYQEAVEMNIEHWCGAEINYDRATIQYKEEQSELSKNELYILKILVQSKGVIVSRDDLIRKLWDDERFVNDNTLTVNVNRLRTCLKEIGLVDVILTKKGLGYMAVSE